LLLATEGPDEFSNLFTAWLDPFFPSVSAPSFSLLVAMLDPRGDFKDVILRRPFEEDPTAISFVPCGLFICKSSFVEFSLST
jgi:hypothetical protein